METPKVSGQIPGAGLPLASLPVPAKTTPPQLYSWRWQNADLLEKSAVRRAAMPLKAAPAPSANIARRQYLRLMAKAAQNRETLSQKQIDELYRIVVNHPVAAVDKLDHYDPTGAIGFCFGRAMTAHLAALKLGLRDDSIGKLFVVGDLKSGEQTEWRFHVTTIVRGPNGWMAIDPIIGKPISVDEWTREMRSWWDHEGKAHMYVTPSQVVLPEIRHMREVDQETGENLIELKFQPSADNGFSLNSEIPVRPGEQLWAPNEQAWRKQFIAVTDLDDGQGFDFGGLTINDSRFDFNGFFVDLLASFSDLPKSKPWHRVGR